MLLWFTFSDKDW